MDRLIIEYLPVVLRNVPEFKALMSAEQPELEALWDAQENVLENQFLVSATELGVKRWERILKIYPKDTDGLNMRRTRVLAILRLKLPYTLRWLRNWLEELCGPGNYTLTVTPYTISLDLGYDNIPEADNLASDIMAMLQTAKPSNMVLDFNALRQIGGAVAIGGITETSLLLEAFPKPDELNSVGNVNFTGYSKYALTVDVYPNK